MWIKLGKERYINEKHVKEIERSENRIVVTTGNDEHIVVPSIETLKLCQISGQLNPK